MEQILLLIIVAAVIIAFLIVMLIRGIIKSVEKKNTNIILEKSEKVKKLLEINKTLYFKPLQSVYYNQHACNSKKQLDNLYIDDYFMDLLDSGEAFYRNIIDSVFYNRSEYTNYLEQVRSIKTTATEEYCQSFGFTLDKFLKHEERVYKKRTLRKPQLDVTVRCKATYTSPQGRNHYWKEQDYNYTELKSFFDKMMKLKAQRQTRQYQINVERSKMTASLRYNILKRDNFRCRICGSSSQDGVKLHVDHIVPVSRGGRTVESNLRTLCDRCNLGKSDKM